MSQKLILQADAAEGLRRLTGGMSEPDPQSAARFAPEGSGTGDGGHIRPAPAAPARASTSAIALSTAALVVSVTFAVVFVVRPAGLVPDVLTVILAVGAAIAPTLIAAAALALLRPAMRGGRAAHALALLAAAAGFVAWGLAVASWSVGFDEADAGVPLSPFASLTLPLLLAAVTLVAGALTAAGYLVGRRPASPLLRLIPTAIVSIPAAVVVLVGAVSPVLPPLVATATLVLAVMLPRAGNRSEDRAEGRTEGRSASAPPAGSAPREPDSTAIPAPVPEHQRNRGARRRATVLAAASLLVSVVIWGGALIASALMAGQPEATTILSSAGGASQLAAIPLLWSATIVLVARRPAWKRSLGIASAVSSILVASAAVALTLGANPDGVLFFSLQPVLALAAAIWTVAIVWPLLRRGTLSRGGALVTTVALALGAGFVYVTVVGMTMGMGLAPASALLATWGVRAALRPRAGVSPAPLPA